MKSRKTLRSVTLTIMALATAIAALVCMGTTANAQDYVTRKYATTVERDVIYGESLGFDGSRVTLRLNYYKPQGDGDRRRPLAIWVHGGGFSGGSRTAFDALSEASAQRGYVAATISYRLGFYRPEGLAYPFAYDTAEVVRANYRAAQDLFGAIRYIIKTYGARDNIDSSFVIVGGASAGGMTCLQAAYVDENERYAATRGASDLVGVTQPQRTDLGPTTGTLHTEVPTPRILAVVNMFGAIQDTSFINNADDAALYQYHQTGDPTVSCTYDQAYWTNTTNVPDNYFYMHGSCNIKKRVEQLGYSPSRHKSWIYDGGMHGFHDPFALDIDIAQFLSPLVTSTITSVDEEQDDVEFVDSEFVDSKHAWGSRRTAGDFLTVVDLTGRVVFDGTHGQISTNAILVDLDKWMQTLPNGAYIAKLGVETRLFMVHR